jgi:hypothetical protein
MPLTRPNLLIEEFARAARAVLGKYRLEKKAKQ